MFDIVQELKYIPYDKYKHRQVDLTIPDDQLLEQWRVLEHKRQHLIQKVLKVREKLLHNSQKQDMHFKHRNNSYVVPGIYPNNPLETVKISLTPL